MVQGGISLTARTDFCIVDGGSLSSDRYITDILEPYVVPFAPYIGNGFIQNNARPHIVRIMNDYLNKVKIRVLAKTLQVFMLLIFYVKVFAYNFRTSVCVHIRFA